MEEAVRIFAIVNLLVIGLSHIVQPKAWVDFFILLASKGTSGALINGFTSLGMGSIIVAFHNVWTGIPTILTIYGWALVFKAAVTFVKPSHALQSMKNVPVDKPGRFVYPGVFFVLLAALLAYDLIANQ
jgi:hypothetical protein